MKKIIDEFLNYEGASGILLLLFAVAALVIFNSPLSETYQSALQFPVPVGFGEFILKKSLGHWINDGLMAIFFLTVGMEIKREFVEGELKEIKSALLPIIAAFGGVICPAIIYTAFNHNNPDTIAGWGIPVATDIAFAVGVLSLLGRHVPRELKVILLSIAIIDDLIAILIIAIFYTANLSLTALGAGAIVFTLLMGLNKAGIKNLIPYLLLGAVLWFFFLKSGVHPTIAGVLLALTIPLKGKPGQKSPLISLEHSLHPWSAFAIMPIFAFANAGFSLDNFSFKLLLDPICLGVIHGLFFGKQIGIFGSIWISNKLGITKKPDAVSWPQIYGLALIAGIGFTVSLFIGNLAFAGNPLYITEVRFSVLFGSFLSAICGYTALRAFSPLKR